MPADQHSAAEPDEPGPDHHRGNHVDEPAPQAVPPSLQALSEWEREIAGLVAEGLSNDEIAGRVHLAVPTVKTHLTRIMGKLGVGNRVQIAVAYLTART